MAGITVGIIALPLSMALAIASGVPPRHGLYTAAIATIVIAATGGSSVNISGPTAAFVVVLLPIVQQFGLGGLLIGGFTLLVLLLWPRLRLRMPGHLIAIVAASLLAFGLNALNQDPVVATINTRFHYTLDGVTGCGLPPILPEFGWLSTLPDAAGQPIGLSFDLVRQIMPAALTIATLGAIESLLCAVVADGMSGRRHNPNDELVGQGIGNLVAPFFGGIPATAAIARTASNVRAGGTSPLVAVTHGVFILLATCFGLTILFDMTIAVGVGMALAGMLFIRRTGDLTETRPLRAAHDNLEPVPDWIAIYDINGPLFFGSAHKALPNLTDVAPHVRAVILDLSEVSMLDMSAVVTMESIVADLGKRGVGLVINNLQPRMPLKLRRAGIRRRQGSILFSRNLREAVEKAHKLAGEAS